MQNSYLRMSRLSGIRDVIIANFLVGVNVVVCKFLIKCIPIFVILEMRFILGALNLFLYILFFKKNFSLYTTEKKFDTSDWFYYILMALSGGFLFNVIFIYGMEYTSATAVGVISSSVPALVAIFSFFILGSAIKRIHFITLFLVILGVVCIKTPYEGQLRLSDTSIDFNFYLGSFIIFLAMIPEALFTVFAKIIKTPVCPIVSGMVINIVNALVCTPFLLFNWKSFSDVPNIFWTVGFLHGIVSGALFFVFYNKGIVKISAPTAGLLTGVIPLSSAVLAIVFLSEPLGMNTVVGMFLVLTAIFLGVKFETISPVLFERIRQK